MIVPISVLRLATVAVLGLGAMTLAAPRAEAQSLFFNWGGDDKNGGAGKQTVRFPSNYRPGELIVSFADRHVYLVTSPGVALSYPVAVPNEKARWSGVTAVSDKRENPTWTPTAHMRAENPRLPSWVPGGHPMNPLGVRAMYLGSSEYRIHGTDAPWTIGTAVSHGCVRMTNQDVLDLYPRVKVGSRVTVTWTKFSGGAAIAEADDTAPVVRTKRSQVRRQSTQGGAGE